MNIRHVLAILMAASFSCVSVAQTPTQIPVEDFLKRDIFGEMKLSPTGEYIAATVPLEDRTDLIILRVSDMQKTGYVRVSTKSIIIDFDWVNPKRVIFSVASYQGYDMTPRREPGLFGVNFDGSGQGRPIVGHGADEIKSDGTLIKKESNEGIHASFIDGLKNDDRQILVQIRKESQIGDSSQYVRFMPTTEAQKVDAVSGS
ncbi:MAG: hypothetical protein ACREO2_01845, partial [Arenimonas sp.]